MEEIWKPIKNYECLYIISNMGVVKSLERRKWIPRNNCFGTTKEKIISGGISGAGYRFVYLSKGGQRKMRTIHTLVWDAFGDKPRDGRRLQVDHIDNNRANNKIENLQLLTQRANIAKGFQDKGRELPTGVYKSRNKYQSTIRHNKVFTHLGMFNSIAEASSAYNNAFNRLEE